MKTNQIPLCNSCKKNNVCRLEPLPTEWCSDYTMARKAIKKVDKANKVAYRAKQVVQ